MRFTHAIVALLALGLSASAGPVFWTLNGVTLSDGVAVTGSFTFDADAGTAPCSTGDSPCGLYSNIDITTTAGGGLPGLPSATYTGVCGPLFCNSSDSTVLNLFFAPPFSPTREVLTLSFAGQGGVPPAGLTDAGGTIDVSDSSPSVGYVLESYCIGEGCFDGAYTVSTSVSGNVSSVPEPSSVLLLSSALALVGLARVRGFHRSRAPRDVA